jgi:hypothetical protein
LILKNRIIKKWVEDGQIKKGLAGKRKEKAEVKRKNNSR